MFLENRDNLRVKRRAPGLGLGDGVENSLKPKRPRAMPFNLGLMILKNRDASLLGLLAERFLDDLLRGQFRGQADVIGG